MARDFYSKINQEEDSFGKSKINSAGLINLTLENLWKLVYNAQSNRNLLKWNNHLDSIWLILGGDEKINSNAVQEYIALEIEIGKSGSLMHIPKGFGIITKEEQKKIALQYRLLLEKSLFLRRLQNVQGKGTAYEDSLEDYMD